MAALTLGMTLSPCLDLLSVYVAGAAFPWGVLLIMSLLMALTTIGLMMLFVFLAMRGMARMKLSWLERYEGQIVGCTLILLSLVLYFV